MDSYNIILVDGVGSMLLIQQAKGETIIDVPSSPDINYLLLNDGNGVIHKMKLKKI